MTTLFRVSPRPKAPIRTASSISEDRLCPHRSYAKEKTRSTGHWMLVSQGSPRPSEIRTGTCWSCRSIFPLRTAPTSLFSAAVVIADFFKQILEGHVVSRDDSVLLSGQHLCHLLERLQHVPTILCAFRLSDQRPSHMLTINNPYAQVHKSSLFNWVF